MKKHGILQHELVHASATLGHTDALVIADAGLAILQGIKRIDPAVAEGFLRFTTIVRADLVEAQTEHAVIAHEMCLKSLSLHAELVALLGAIPADEVGYDEFKHMTP